MLAFLPAMLLAHELPTGEECTSTTALSASTPNQFDAGWFHNWDPDKTPLNDTNNRGVTPKQDGYSPVQEAANSSWTELNWAQGQQGANQNVVVGRGQDEITGAGITLYHEGLERTRYLIGGPQLGSADNTTLADAIGADQYLQYAFTTPGTLQPGTFFRKVHVLSYQASKFKFAVLASTDPAFGSYWTLVKDYQVDLPGTDSNGWRHFTADNTRFPLLKPSTTYYLRLYVYAAEKNAVIADAQYLSGNSPQLPPLDGNGQSTVPVIVADDFMFGTGVCPPPQVTISKVSRNRVGTFDFSGTNGYTSHSIVTTAAGTAVAASPSTLATGYTQTEITEADNTAFKLTAISCPSLAASAYTTTPATSGSGGGKLTLNPEAVQWGSSVACTFTNDPADVDLSVTKSNAATALVSGQQTTYTLRVENKGPGPGDGTVLRDTPGAGLSGCVVSSCSASPTPAAQCPATPSNVLAAAGAPIPSLPKDGWVQLQVQCNVD